MRGLADEPFCFQPNQQALKCSCLRSSSSWLLSSCFVCFCVTKTTTRCNETSDILATSGRVCARNIMNTDQIEGSSPCAPFYLSFSWGHRGQKRRRKSKESLPIIGSRSREGVVEEPYCPLGHAKSTQKTMWPVWIVLDLSGQHSFPPICPRGSCVLHDLCAARRTERGPSRHLRLHSNGVSVVIVVSVVHTKLKAVNRAILP